jgi:glutathione synthase/RimK-type ligase-like ATP-grasp enzyme
METYITFVAGDGHSTDTTETLPYPIVAKHIYGSRGTGNFLIKTKEELSAWLVGKTLTNYIFEKFYNYSREYRLHISKNGCFYACRKMLKNDIPKDKRWYRNDSNSTWILEENPAFNKPATWDTIIKECIIALNTIGLDLAAFDVKVEAKDSNKFIIIESNSAPSFGENTLKQYINEIPKIIY